MSIESAPSLPVLDLDGALDRLGGDQALFLELVSIVLEDMPGLYQQIESAAINRDAPQVRATAHALKGLVAGCGGMRAASVAQSLETAGQQGELQHVERLIESLDAELAFFTESLEALRAR